MSRRDLSRYDGIEHHEFSSIPDFLAAEVPAGVLTIDYNGSPLDILNQPAGSKTTIVTFHTALSPKMRTLPVFSGGGITAGIGANLIFVSDPTLEYDDDLALAWFAGNKAQPLQRDLPEVLRHILDSQGAEHVIFFGASGGGFASLYYSRLFPGSLAVSVNPQLIIKDYHQQAVLAYASAAFGAADMGEAKDVLADKVTGDLRHAYRGGSQNTVAFMQNVMDTHHLFRHLAHFLDAVPQSSNIHMAAADWGMGHVPPPKEVLWEVLVESVKAAPEWGTALKRLGFLASPTSRDAIAARESLPA